MARTVWPAAVVYVVAALAANLTATSFVPLPGFGLVAVGTLFFGVTFTQRDRIHRAGGRRAAYATIGAAAVLFAAESVVLDVPWRIVGASLLAILLAEAADTEVYHRLRRRGWYARVAGSNAVSIPLDSVVFTVAAFGGVVGWGTIAAIVWGDVVAKFAVGSLAALRRDRDLRRPVAERPAWGAAAD